MIVLKKIKEGENAFIEITLDSKVGVIRTDGRHGGQSLQLHFEDFMELMKLFQLLYSQWKNVV